MRRLIVQEFVTLDGLAAGPRGETDFIPAAVVGDARFADSQMRFIDSVDTMVLGRNPGGARTLRRGGDRHRW